MNWLTSLLALAPQLLKLVNRIWDGFQKKPMEKEEEKKEDVRDAHDHAKKTGRPKW